MQEKNNTGIVPKNKKGSQVDVVSARESTSTEEASKLFSLACDRLLHVSSWHDLTKPVLAQFQLCDTHGDPVEGEARKGWLIRVDAPGPGTAGADGFDWVKIEAVERSQTGKTESLAMRVRPTEAPSGGQVTAHFYSESATSTFSIKKDGNIVTAAIYDRNLETNQEAENLTDRIRNAIVGFAGQKIFSKIQWQALADGLVGL